MSIEMPTKLGQGLEQKKIHRIELPNGVYFDLREKSRGVYEITDRGINGKNFNGMMLDVKPKKRSFEDLEDPEHESWDWVAGTTTHFKYKDMEFDFDRGEIHAPSARAIKEVVSKLDINLVDAADRDY